MRKGQRHTDEARAKVAAARRSAPAKGTSLKPSGYVEYTRGPHKGRAVHDVTMEQSIGRRLKPEEQVHHRDGNRSNNDLANLELTTRAAHARMHRLIDHHLRTRNARGQFSGGE